MTVNAIIKRKLTGVISAAEDDDVASLAGKLARHNVGILIILKEAGGLAGVVSERDIVRALARHKAGVLSQTARDVMTRKVFVCTPEESELQVMTYMLEKHIRHMPVIEDGKVTGMVSLADAVKQRLTKIGHLIRDVAEEGDGERRLGIFSRHLKERKGPKLA